MEIEDRLSRLFMALADKTRLKLLEQMADEELNVSWLHQFLGESQPKVSRHLAYLRNADLVDTRRDGKQIFYRLKWPRDEGLRSIIRYTLLAIRDTTGNAVMITNNISGVPNISAHNDLDEYLL